MLQGQGNRAQHHSAGSKRRAAGDTAAGESAEPVCVCKRLRAGAGEEAATRTDCAGNGSRKLIFRESAAWMNISSFGRAAALFPRRKINQMLAGWPCVIVKGGFTEVLPLC